MMPAAGERRRPSATAASTAYAACAGVVAVALTHPLDTWAVSRQTSHSLPGGMRVLYRGLGPALIQAGLIYGVMLGTYEHLRNEMSASVVAAAALSAVPESMVKGPLEAVKNMKQTKQTIPSLISIKALRLGGIGFAACLAREVPGNVAYFWCYESSRRKGFSLAVSGALAATGFTLCSYPFEVLRAQVVTGAPKQITFRGIGPYLVRGIAVTSCLFTSYEWFNASTVLGRN